MVWIFCYAETFTPALEVLPLSLLTLKGVHLGNSERRYLGLIRCLLERAEHGLPIEIRDIA